jgi:hypothetical protein
MQFNPTSRYQATLIKESIRQFGKKKGLERAMKQIRSIGAYGAGKNNVEQEMGYRARVVKVK